MRSGWNPFRKVSGSGRTGRRSDEQHEEDGKTNSGWCPWCARSLLRYIGQAQGSTPPLQPVDCVLFKYISTCANIQHVDIYQTWQHAWPCMKQDPIYELPEHLYGKLSCSQLSHEDLGALLV